MPTLKYIQRRVDEWMSSWATEKETEDLNERGLRLIEEAVELGQALGIPIEQQHAVIDYVYSRPSGLPVKELGGVLVTIGAVGNALGVSLDEIFDYEMKRIDTPEVMERCRKRQSEKRALIGSGHA